MGHVDIVDHEAWHWKWLCRAISSQASTGPKGQKGAGSVLPMTQWSQCDRSDVKWHKIYILSSCLHIFTLLYSSIYIYCIYYSSGQWFTIGDFIFDEVAEGDLGGRFCRGHLGHGYPRTPDTGDAGKGGQMQICAAQAVTCQVSWFSLAAHPADHPDHWAIEKDPQRK